MLLTPVLRRTSMFLTPTGQGSPVAKRSCVMRPRLGSGAFCAVRTYKAVVPQGQSFIGKNRCGEKVDVDWVGRRVRRQSIMHHLRYTVRPSALRAGVACAAGIS